MNKFLIGASGFIPVNNTTAPITPPSVGLAPNTCAEFTPVKMTKYVNIPFFKMFITSMICCQFAASIVPAVTKFVRIAAIPATNPDPTNAGIIGTKIFEISFKIALNGEFFCFAFCAAFISAALAFTLSFPEP